jgi:hypothetical protein
MSGSTKVAATAALFLVAVATVALSVMTHRSLPLFFAWVPLIGVGWVLTRPEPAGEALPQGTEETSEANPPAGPPSADA